MVEIAAIVIGIMLTIQGFKLMADITKARRELKNLKRKLEDQNIEFSAQEGTGIELVKKEYPNLELKDDFRCKVDKQQK